jgi:glycosyltransferase involved in cell wall biosynthesis
MPECDFTVFAASTEKLIGLSANFALPHVRVVALPRVSAARRLLWQLPKLARQHELDLLHTQYIVPPFSPCRTAVTVHDILFESHPEFFDKLFVLRSRLMVRRSVRQSAEVFTVSEFSRQQICESYGVGSDKVHTILNGVDTLRFFPGQEGRDVLDNIGLTPGQYFLTVGRLEPRKNHSGLLRAWARLSAPRPRLAIVGQRHFGYDAALSLVSSLHLEQDVVVLESISDSQLPAIFRHARAFVYCSMAEGFGMPVLEAMASGIPVISSANTALSEICAQAAVLIDPQKTDNITDAIRELDQDSELRQDLARRGLDRVRDFTWESSADVVVKRYRRCLKLT